MPLMEFVKQILATLIAVETLSLLRISIIKMSFAVAIVPIDVSDGKIILTVVVKY